MLIAQRNDLYQTFCKRWQENFKELRPRQAEALKTHLADPAIPSEWFTEALEQTCAHRPRQPFSYFDKLLRYKMQTAKAVPGHRSEGKPQAESKPSELITQEIKVPVAKLRPGPYQNRKHFNREKMAEMVSSIRASGVINPPIVFQENGHYELLTGERRWRASAALMLSTQKDGISLERALDLVCCDEAAQAISEEPLFERLSMTVRLVIGEDKEKALHLVSVIENGQREDLNPIEEALDYHGLRKAYKWSHNKIGQVVGKNGTHVRNRLELLRLEPEIQGLIAKGTLSKDGRVTEALLSVPDALTRIELARRFSARRTSVKAIQIACRKVKETLSQASSPASSPKSRAKRVSSPAKVKVVKKPQVAHICSDTSFCQPCADKVLALAEELCPGCLTNGVTGKCRECPGLLEFIETLKKYAEKAVPLYIGGETVVHEEEGDLEDMAA